MTLIHASCVAIGADAILLRGPSGSGKSDLALRLIHNGAALVADDQVRLRIQSGGLLASPPDTLAGLLEVRGVGILRTDYLPQAPVRLVVDLAERAMIERLPDACVCVLEGITLPCIALHAFDASAVAKLHAALACYAAKTGQGGIRLCA